MAHTEPLSPLNPLSPFSPSSRFGGRVRDCFNRHAAAYEQGARLQTAIAARLGQLCRSLRPQIPAGPRADLGAGSGLLSRALETSLGGPPLLREALPQATVWSLERAGHALLGADGLLNAVLEWMADGPH